MPDVNVKGRYRIYTHDGVEPLLFTSYSNSLCSIRRPNPNTFITISTYIPGSLSPFTTFDPGSSYTIVTKSNTADFSMGPYTRSDRLPSSVTFRNPNFYHGLDKNSITVALSSYALSVNAPLSTAFTYIPNQDGYFVNSISFNTQRFNQGLPSLLTHLTPNSSYQFINRTPYTFFAPLQSEMGDAYAIGNNSGGEFGMGHRYSPFTGAPNTNNYFTGLSVIAEQTYGIWDKIVTSNSYETVNESGQIINATSFAALSVCGSGKVIFVLGQNLYGQLGTGSDKQYYATWTKIPGVWNDVEMGSQHMLATNSSGHLYACGRNSAGQLGLGSDTLSANTLTLVDNSRNYIELAPGGSSTIVRDSLGRIWGCGYNGSGILGLNSTSSPVFTLTQEATNSTWTKVRYGVWGGYVVALKENKLFGAGPNSNFYGAGGGSQKNIFTQEILGLTDIVDFYISTFGTYIKRIGQGLLYASGSNGSVNGSSRLAALSGTTIASFTRTAIPSDITKIISIDDGGQGTIGYIRYNRLYGRTNPKTFQIIPDLNVFDVYPECSSNNTIFLLKDGNIRPTPTPTPTITPTPSPVPSLPYNALQVGIFGTSFQLNTNITSTQVVFNNTPGNLSNNFTLETINSGSIPPGATIMTTFDFEKTAAFNNIVGISVIQQYNQNPSGREYCRYLYKKSGSTWTYTLLPSQFDALSKTNPYLGYRSSQTGADNLFITPPNPNYFGTAQGIYFLMFVRDETFYEAVSYDRGVNWQISPFFGPLGTSQYFSNSEQGICKILYSRTRESNYKVQAVGFSNNATDGMPYESLYFSERFPNSTAKETISSISNTWGFDFKHDYFNVPTVVSYAIDRDSPGIPSNTIWGRLLIHRKIGNNWQTNIIKAGITPMCYGPDYQVPTGIGVYKRLNSPTISIEFDSRNPDIIYVAYMLSIDNVATPAAGLDPTCINVLCYNMKTNSIVFEENVVKASPFLPGAYILTLPDGYVVDIPSLYFDTSDNTLNLFFIAPKGGIGSATVQYHKTKRLGTNSWASISNLSTGSVRPFITGSRELKIKY
jgi:hypothetical protein